MLTHSTASAQFFLTLGGILLLGLLTSMLARQIRLPRVTLLLVFGVLIGRHGLDLVPGIFTNRFEMVADMTLLLVGFLLGGKLTATLVRCGTATTVAPASRWAPCCSVCCSACRRRS